MPSVTRGQLAEYLDALLEPGRFKDYCPNGLQVEGRERIASLLTGVSASQALLDAAVARRADAILVHHGYFWRGEDGRITGIRRRRLATLLGHEINLFAFHLPLDAHPEYGNNAGLARQLGWAVEAHFGEQDLGCLGGLAEAMPLSEFTARVAAALGRPPVVIGDPARTIRKVAWCSGGAQSWFEQAIAAGADCYVSGEVSEPVWHLAHESGVAYVAAGHHATERFGVMALGEHLRQRFGIEVAFVDSDNPI